VKDFKFKRGSLYSRDDIHNVYFRKPVPKIGTGNWTTGYVRPTDTNDLIIFMNIGVPGTTGHDFNNKYNPDTGLIEWFGKPKTHSNQNTFKKLISKEYTPHFFARWDSKNTKFLYLGTGEIVHYIDGVETKQGPAIKCIVNCSEVNNIIESSKFDIQEEPQIPSEIEEEQLMNDPSSFEFEKHLEGYIVKNWENTIFGSNYNIYENGRQYPTETGPLDILAQKKDKSEFMVLELKRDKTSDVAVGQTLRYMGYIQKTLSLNGEKVRGSIIGTQEDKNLRNAISMVPDIDFYRYNLTFSLNKMSF
jgi:hypothetical protein